MDRKAITKLVAITAAFILLGFGYVYFQEQSLLSSGKTNADTVVQMMQDSDQDSVKTRLAEFVGDIEPDQDEEYNQALISVDYIAGLIADGNELAFVEGQLGVLGGFDVYSAVYKIAAPQGGEDFFVITLRRDEGEWVLSNAQLHATNPFAQSQR